MENKTKEYYIGCYYSDDIITPERIEEMWRKETQNPITKPQSKEIRKALDDKYNQKQYKEFNEDLFKAYINKFSNEDKIKALNCILEFDSVANYAIDTLSKK